MLKLCKQRATQMYSKVDQTEIYLNGPAQKHKEAVTTSLNTGTVSNSAQLLVAYHHGMDLPCRP